MDEKQLRSALRKGPDCPAVEILSADLAESKGPGARTAAELHLAQCLHCRTEIELLREFEAGTVRPDETAAAGWISARLKQGGEPKAATHSTGWHNAWGMPKFVFGFAGVAIVTLLAIGISSEWKVQRLATQPVPEFGNEVQRARVVEIVPKPGFFEWKPVHGAARYDFEARTIDGSVIFHNTFTGTSLAFPAQIGALVKAGKLVEWEVMAKDSAGGDIAGSGVQHLRSGASSAQ